MRHRDTDYIVSRGNRIGWKPLSLRSHHNGQPGFGRQDRIGNGDRIVRKCHGGGAEAVVGQITESAVQPRPGNQKDRTHGHPDRTTIQRIARVTHQQHGIHPEGGRRTKNGTNVRGVHHTVDDDDAPGSVCWFLRTFASNIPRKLGNDAVNLDKPMRNMSVSQRQMCEIAKAISYNSKVIVLDEPTSSLTVQEVDKLFDMMRMLRDQGIYFRGGNSGNGLAVLHHMEEVYPPSLYHRMLMLRPSNTDYFRIIIDRLCNFTHLPLGNGYFSFGCPDFYR